MLASVHVVQCSQGEFGGMNWSMQQVSTDVRDVAEKVFFVVNSKQKTDLPWPDVVLGVWVIQRGEVAGFVDLRPFVGLEFKGRHWTVDELHTADTDVLDEIDDGWVPFFSVDRQAIAAAVPALTPR